MYNGMSERRRMLRWPASAFKPRRGFQEPKEGQGAARPQHHPRCVQGTPGRGTIRNQRARRGWYWLPMPFCRRIQEAGHRPEHTWPRPLPDPEQARTDHQLCLRSCRPKRRSRSSTTGSGTRVLATREGSDETISNSPQPVARYDAARQLYASFECQRGLPSCSARRRPRAMH